MRRLVCCCNALVFAPLAGPCWSETVLWLPVYEPPGFYSVPAGGIAWSPGGEHVAYTRHEYVPPQYHWWKLRLLALDGRSNSVRGVE